ncbi:MAG: sigma-E processing peptidase SpoIIGA [Bacillota bacterium]|nr:sigma-E processing peptidase SpoIIGA [Bacillota bacterium]
MRVVYLDALFLFNFSIDFLLIRLTSAIAGKHVKTARIILASLIGAVYACIVFFMPKSFLSGLVKILGAVLCVIIAFRFTSFKSFLKLTLLLLAITFSFGGGFYGLYSLFGDGRKMRIVNGVPYLEISPVVFGAIFFLLYGIIKLSFYIFTRSRASQRKLLDVNVDIFGESKKYISLVDTGHKLTEPFTKFPVLVVEDESLEKQISCAETGVYIIPFRSVGNGGDILIGIRPECVQINGKKIDDIIIAPTALHLSGDGEFNALIGEDALVTL